MKVFLFFLLFVLEVIFPFAGNGQFVTISGFVTQNSSDKALENVSVFERNSGIGTISGKDGYYKLILPPGAIDISFSENGYITLAKEMMIEGDTLMIIHLVKRKNLRNTSDLNSENNNENDEGTNVTSGRKRFF